MLQTFTYTAEEALLVREVVFPVVADLPELPGAIAPQKSLLLSGVNENGVVRFTINGKTFPDMEDWQVPLGEDLQVEIKNDLGMDHPFHLHGQFFQVISPMSQVVKQYGMKDTVLVAGQSTVVVRVFFNNPGVWMFHCHIPEHSENGMMGHVHVNAPDAGTAP